MASSRICLLRTASGFCSRWCWPTPVPPSATTSSRATTRCAACSPCRAAPTRPPIPSWRTDMSIHNRILPLALAAALAAAAAPAAAADYVQSSGALSFASEYQGETFVGLFPDFNTTLSFDPAAPQDASLDVTIPLATANTRSGDRHARSEEHTSELQSIIRISYHVF